MNGLWAGWFMVCVPFPAGCRSHPALYSLDTGAFPVDEMARAWGWSFTYICRFLPKRMYSTCTVWVQCYNTVMSVRGIHTHPVKNMGLFRKVCHPRCVRSIYKAVACVCVCVCVYIYVQSWTQQYCLCSWLYVFIDIYTRYSFVLWVSFTVWHFFFLIYKKIEVKLMQNCNHKG